jgi:hypothetical protein
MSMTQRCCAGCGVLFQCDPVNVPKFEGAAGMTRAMCQTCFGATNQLLAQNGAPPLPNPPAGTYG